MGQSRSWFGLVQVAVRVADGADEQGDVLRQTGAVGAADLLGEQADADLAALEEAEAEVLGIVHVLFGLEQGELILARLGVVRAEGGAVAALVAHPVDMQNFRPAVGQADDDVGAVRADIGAVLADGVAVEAALALALDVLRHSKDALLRNGLGHGRVGGIGNFVGVLLADHDLRKLRSVGDAFNDGGGAAVAVACGVNALDVRLERGTLAAHFNAVGRHQVGIDLLADGGNDEVTGDFDRLTGGNGASSAGSVGCAKLHLVADQLAVLLFDGRDQLEEVHTVGNCQLQLLSIGGHILLRAAIDQRGGGCACALCDSGCVHGGVAAADDGDVAELAALTGLHFLQPADNAADIAGDIELAGLPCADGIEDVSVALLFQLLDGGGLGVQADFRAVGHHEGDVLVNGLVADAEFGDDVANDAAEGVRALKDRALHTGAAEEVSRRNAGRAAADDGSLFALDLGGLLHGREQRVVAVFGGEELRCADLDGLVVEITRALTHAAVGADGAGDERQGVLLGDERERLVIQALLAQLDVLGDVLLDGAAALAGSNVAIHPRHALLVLAGGQRLDGLDMVVVRAAFEGHFGNGFGVGGGEGLELHALDLLCHLDEAVVAARLEDGGGDGDGPDARCQQLVAVEEFRAAGEGDLHPAAELCGNAAAHFDRQREQGAAGHVHLVVRQLAAGGIDGEGVRQLQAEFQTALVGQRLQALEHGNGVLPLQVLVEVMVVEDDVVIAHRIEDIARILVAEDGGVALDEGVDLLLGDEVGGDALDLIGRAAVQR